MSREKTMSMIDDFRRYVKDPEAFAVRAIEAAEEYGDIIRVEETRDASGSVIERRYYTDDSDVPDYELNAIRVGVESL